MSLMVRFFRSLGIALCAGTLCQAAGASEPEPLSPDRLDWEQEREFWSFRKPLPQPRPSVQNGEWPRQPLDYFILARLEQDRLRPSPEAENRTLIRRVTFDLTGLPPTPGEVADFLADNGADAYERLVERLLASPRFGERLASLWLPLARYAEDQAHQVGSDTKFFYPNAYRYRQWIIDAFNSDLPYDQFVKFQLAADKFDSAATPDLAALGFLGLGPKYYNRGRLEVMADEWEDRVDTVTRTMLGMTVACARCHDHKFEPITMRDYYALAGVFASTRMVNKTDEGKVLKGDITADKMGSETLHMVEDGEVKNLNVFIRGDAGRKGPEVERRFLRVLSSGEPESYDEDSGRRRLAEAIANRENPLTARVMVNRVWAAFFGKPIVPTPSNFGHSGEPPTHPALLDDLAVRFMDGGWSIKELAREMVRSATYRQSSTGTASAEAIDPANALLWRMERRRLSIEQWRDALLFVSGKLEGEGGKSFELDDSKNRRRTVYARVSRLKLNDLLMQFDYPDANVHAEKRALTITPMQKLFALNSPFMLEQSAALAARVQSNADAPDNEARVRLAYDLLYGRLPSATELRLGLEFIEGADSTGASGWEQYAQVLLAANEMMYVD